jgi:2-keto-4-pentenoate hydratase
MTRQLEQFHRAEAERMKRLGWKVGLNDPAAQARMGIEGIIVGWLDSRRSFAAGADYRPAEGAVPRLELEAAIVLERDVAATASLDAARNAIEHVAPAFEFVNGAKPLQPLDEFIGQDILHDGLMLGEARPIESARGLVEAGLPVARVNGEVVRTGLPGRYPDDLAEIVVAVAAVLEKHGESLLAGDVIIGGSYVDPFPVAVGDVVEADFGPLGALKTVIV